MLRIGRPVSCRRNRGPRLSLSLLRPTFAPGPLVTLLEGQFSLVGRQAYSAHFRRRDIPLPKVNAASSQMPSSGHNQRHRRYDRSAKGNTSAVQWVNHPAPRLS